MATPSDPASRTRIHEGPKFAVERLAIPGRGGQPIIRDLIVHPGAVLVLPIDDDGRVIMIRNHRFAVGRTLWELPAGTLEKGEDPAVCAGRELIEETGYQAAQIRPLCRFYTTPGFCDELMHVFVATRLTEVGQELEDYEQIEVHPLPMDLVLQMIRSNEIEDAKSIAAILHFQAFA